MGGREGFVPGADVGVPVAKQAAKNCSTLKSVLFMKGKGRARGTERERESTREKKRMRIQPVKQ